MKGWEKHKEFGLFWHSSYCLLWKLNALCLNSSRLNLKSKIWSQVSWNLKACYNESAKIVSAYINWEDLDCMKACSVLFNAGLTLYSVSFRTRQDGVRKEKEDGESLDDKKAVGGDVRDGGRRHQGDLVERQFPTQWHSLRPNILPLEKKHYATWIQAMDTIWMTNRKFIHFCFYIFTPHSSQLTISPSIRIFLSVCEMVKLYLAKHKSETILKAHCSWLCLIFTHLTNFHPRV